MLNPKNRRDIISVASRLVSDSESIKSILDNFDQSFAQFVSFNSRAYFYWGNIVDYAAKNDQLDDLLQVIQDMHHGATDLHNLREEIKLKSSPQIQKIINAINRNQCILFLGPGMLTYDRKKKSQIFHSSFARLIAKELRQFEIHFDESLEENLPYMAQKFKNLPSYIDGDLGIRMKKYFKSDYEKLYLDSFDGLACLNFPVIINTNPDKELYNRLGPERAVFRYYNSANLFVDDDAKEQKEKEEEENKQSAFWKNKTIFYNMLGSFENIHSIVFTEADYVSFSKNILQGNPPVLDRVKASFDPTKFYLFLGFNFKEWPLKLILESFKLEKREERGVSLYLEDELSDRVLQYYDNEYNFHFVNSDLHSFIENIVQQCTVNNH